MRNGNLLQKKCGGYIIYKQIIIIFAVNKLC